MRARLGGLALVAGFLAGCGRSEEPEAAPVGSAANRTPEASVGAPSGAPTDELIGQLSSLGYVEFDPVVDPTLSGVVRHDRTRSSPGYNLYGSGGHEVFLVDMDGKRVHTWSLPPKRQRTTFAELLADDTLAVVQNYQLLTRLDWDSKILWDLDLRAHHDVAQCADGSLLVPFRKPETFQGRKVRFDGLAHVSLAGVELSRWYSFEHLEELHRYHPASPLDQPLAPGEVAPEGERIPDYHHLNTVEVLPETELGRRDLRFRAGNVLVCFRNLSVIAVLDQDDYGVQWSWGADELEGAHMPTMLADGHILVFDNGARRHWTRVLELDPASGSIVWQYRGDPPESFYSELRGSAQRLPNGNTLICEADRGHVIEVTRAGEVVWEFWNPEVTPEGRRRIYRFLRYPVERMSALLARAPR
jgi:hypothetical protein